MTWYESCYDQNSAMQLILILSHLEMKWNVGSSFESLPLRDSEFSTKMWSHFSGELSRTLRYWGIQHYELAL